MNNECFIKKDNIVILFLPTYLYGPNNDPVESMLNLNNITKIERSGDDRTKICILREEDDCVLVALSYEKVKKIIKQALRYEGETEPVSNRFEILDIQGETNNE